MNKVEQFYNQEYDEWNRLERHKIEFDITKRHLDKIINKAKSKIFDCGGGPGRYSIYLSQKGHDLTLLDLSKKNIDVALVKNKELNGSISRFIHGDALKLDDYNLEKYDYILLMGPLYHITDLNLRKAVLNNLHKYLKDDGVIIASFISNYAPIVDQLKYTLPLNGDKEQLLDYLKDGTNNEDKGFTTAYFSSSEEAIDLMNLSGFKKELFINVENILAFKEAEINQLGNDEYQQWLDICYHLGTDEKLLGTGEHYLYIGSKK